MPRPSNINPKTGKRYDYVPPEKRGPAAARAAEASELQREILLRERQMVALKARDDLLVYTKFTMPHPDAPDDVSRSLYEDEQFHRLVAKALQDWESGKTPQLIFVMPPRHGKTEMATKRLAAWVSGRHPDWDLAVASYSDTMAADFGADTRAILTSSQHRQVFPDYRLRRGGSAKDNIQTERGGRLVFVGRGGALTGRGMNAGMGDDLFKDHAEASSQTIRDQAWNWFVKVFMTRRMGLKLVLLTMTRWHSDDIIGRLTDPENQHYNAEEAKKWKIIRLPALAEEDDPLGRKPGEALWPARYDADFLESQRRMDPLGFEALYQQNPTVADGTLFQRENIRYYEPKDLPDELRFYCASDHAVATEQRNDPSCLIKVGVDRYDNVYILDCYWRRAKTDVVVEAMLDMGAGGNMRPLIWWAERGHISKSIGPFLRKRMSETGRYINVVEVTPVGDKAQRAQSIAARVAMGKVLFPKASWWTEKAINELMAFPNGTHDDFVDALAYIGLGLPRQVKASAPPKASSAPRFGTIEWVKYAEKWKKDEQERRAAGGF